ncbi:MAG: hypothetical protein LC708_02160, partial [Actinobacteria bacterium]|nr:hypothetical protein [Actinomycetota bacterium]
YRFQARYSGDANNAPQGPTACTDPLEDVLVQAAPGLTTVASPTVPLGGPVSDTATLTGGITPTGTITFDLFGPDNPTCTGAPIFTSTVPVNGNGDYQSGPFTPTLPGVYRFQARYSGDANNTPQGPTACTDPLEDVLVQAVPGLTTVASPPVDLGGAVFDTATLTGGQSPTGTITFDLFGPDNPTCTGAPIFTSTVPVNGNGDYQSGDFTPALPGVYRFQARYSGDANNVPQGPTACTDPLEDVVVRAAPALTTVASPPVLLGGTVSDTATLTGGITPTGTITFELFGPDNPTCTGAPVFTSTVPVAGNGDYQSGDFLPVVPGVYRFQATYSGDANNAPQGPTACTDPLEDVLVTAAPGLTTIASSTVPLGGAVFDTATLAGGNSPTGTITFDLFGPTNPTCTGAPIFTSTVTVTDNGSYQSDSFTPVLPGRYRWVARYSGDANNTPQGPTACTDRLEDVLVMAAPGLTTVASPSVPLGGAVFDTATLTGGILPSGTITFDLFGPDNPTCTGAPVFTSTVPVAGNGVYQSGPFTPTLPGVYRFQARYSGDVNNTPQGPTPCTDPLEDVVVQAAPGLTTVASPSVPLGGSVFDTATLTGGNSPTGTITFDLFGPDNPTCTGAPVFTSTVAVTGNGDYQSGPFTPVLPGVYRFQARYSGDANNLPQGPTACADPLEDVLVTAMPALTTTASPSVPEGGVISDTATLTGGITPTGTILFELFGPDNPTCAGAPVFTSTVPVAGNGVYPSGDFTTQVNGPAGPGTYRWVATYSGDANNLPQGPTACADPLEDVLVTAMPALTTTASPSVPEGGVISDTATLTGGIAPTGTILFELFGPDNPTCAGVPIFTSTVTVAGNGVYPSGNFTTQVNGPAGPGTYRWVATYSGDANNAPAGPTAC